LKFERVRAIAVIWLVPSSVLRFEISRDRNCAPNLETVESRDERSKYSRSSCSVCFLLLLPSKRDFCVYIQRRWWEYRCMIWFVHVSYSNMLQHVPTIAPTHSNAFVRVGATVEGSRSILEQWRDKPSNVMCCKCVSCHLILF